MAEYTENELALIRTVYGWEKKNKGMIWIEKHEPIHLPWEKYQDLVESTFRLIADELYSDSPKTECSEGKLLDFATKLKHAKQRKIMPVKLHQEITRFRLALNKSLEVKIA